jgi:hypothetical protein
MRFRASETREKTSWIGRLGSVGVVTSSLVAGIFSPCGLVLADAPIVVARPGNDGGFDVFDNAGNRIGGSNDALFNPRSRSVAASTHQGQAPEISLATAPHSPEGASPFLSPIVD